MTSHLPGDQNNISHILGHLAIGEEPHARHDYFTRYGTTVMACPDTVHSFHGPPAPPDPQEDPLSPYQLVHLNLSAVDATEMQRAYLADDTPVQSVPLSDVYRVGVITGHLSQSAVPTLHRERINAWRNKRLFSVPSPEGNIPLLFSTAGATVLKHPDSGDSTTDSTRHLVTVIPKGAAVKVTDSESVTEPSDPSDGSYYADHDLRRDLLPDPLPRQLGPPWSSQH